MLLSLRGFIYCRAPQGKCKGALLTPSAGAAALHSSSACKCPIATNSPTLAVNVPKMYDAHALPRSSLWERLDIQHSRCCRGERHDRHRKSAEVVRGSSSWLLKRSKVVYYEKVC